MPVNQGSCRWKKLFVWQEVVDLMDLNLLPQQRGTKSPSAGGEGSAMITLSETCTGHVGVGRLQPITSAAEWMIHCSLLVSLTVAAANLVIEDARMDSMSAPLESRPLKAVLSADFRVFTDWWLKVHFSEKERGDGTQPWGHPVLMVLVSETCDPVLLT